MEISYSSCFEFALDYLRWLGSTTIGHSDLISNLKMGVRLLQSFDLYLTKCRRRRNHETCLEQDEEEKDATSSRIQDLIIKRMQDLEFVCIECLIHSRSLHSTHVESELTIFLEAIKLFFETDINESCINYLLDCYWLHDPELVLDFIDSFSETLVEFYMFRSKGLDEKLMFLKSFIRFAMLRGVEDQQLIHLLIHTEVVAINALHLFSIWWFNKIIDNDEVCKEMELQISQLMHEKIYPGDPQVRETYIHVLTASKLSISSDTSALEKSKQTVADFMDRLLPKQYGNDCLLPKTIWNIKTLRHLWTTDPDIGFMFPVENLEVSPGLDHLDTLSLVIDPSSQSLQKILTKLPNIRRLRCKMTESREEPTRIGDGILVFDWLSKLESLTLLFFDGYGFKFPLNLKKLTLAFHVQPWSEISTIGKLPKLEALKLLDHSFFGEEWEMKEGELPSLRVLKLRTLLDFRIWTASSDNFPRLEKLVV